MVVLANRVLKISFTILVPTDLIILSIILNNEKFIILGYCPPSESMGNILLFIILSFAMLMKSSLL